MRSRGSRSPGFFGALAFTADLCRQATKPYALLGSALSSFARRCR